MPDLLERLRAALKDRYEIESEIGRGGMATVFLAEDLKHHRKVAIKVLHPELAAAVGGQRFLQEIETVASLNHPHIFMLIDSGEADGLLYYVMPYAEGESLRRRLDREKQLPVDEAVRIAVEVADGHESEELRNQNRVVQLHVLDIGLADDHQRGPLFGMKQTLHRRERGGLVPSVSRRGRGATREGACAFVHPPRIRRHGRRH